MPSSRDRDDCFDPHDDCSHRNGFCDLDDPTDDPYGDQLAEWEAEQEWLDSLPTPRLDAILAEFSELDEPPF